MCQEVVNSWIICNLLMPVCNIIIFIINLKAFISSAWTFELLEFRFLDVCQIIIWTLINYYTIC